MLDQKTGAEKRFPRVTTGAGAALTVLAMLTTAACSSSGASGEGVEGELIYAVEDFGNDSMDPAMETNGPMQSSKFMMWDTLIDIGPEGELVPGIAEKWELSKDGLTWNVDIREGVKFHNGEELAADDVVFSLERMMSPDATYSQAAQAQTQIASVEQIDDQTVAIHTNDVQVSLPYLISAHRSLAGVVFPKDYMLEEGGKTFEQQRELLEEAPVGSGPFRFVERVRGEAMTFEATDEHWRATPTISRVEVILVPEEATRISMLQADEVDIINVVPDKATTLEDSGYDVRTVEDGVELALFLPGIWRNGADTEPAGDVRVRQALSLAIDRQAIIDSLLDGRGSLKTTPYNTSPATQDVVESEYEDWAAEANAYDPERAKELLAEAGYPDGFDGMKLFTFPLPDSPNLAQVGDIVAAQWAEIGVKAEIVPTDYTTYRPHLFQTGLDDEFNRGDANTYGYPTRHDAIGGMLAYMAYDGGNFQLVNDREFDGLVKEAAATTDDGAREELVREAYDLFNSQWPVINVAMADSVYAVNPDTVGEWTTIPTYPYLGRTFETIQAP